MAKINQNVGEPFFNRLRGAVKKLTEAGYKGVHLNTDLQMVITDEQVAQHHLFYPTSPLVLVTMDNLPETIEDVELLFMRHPLYPKKTKEEEGRNVAELLNDLEEETKVVKPKASRLKQEKESKKESDQEPKSK